MGRVMGNVSKLLIERKQEAEILMMVQLLLLITKNMESNVRTI